MSNHDADIIVCGGGLAGLTLSLLLAKSDFKVICIDRDDLKCSAPADKRTTAISFGSQKIIEPTGIWKNLEKYACPILNIEVLEGDSPVLMDFTQKELTQEISSNDNRAFGWVIENIKIKQALYKALKKQKNVKHLSSQKVENFNLHDSHVDVVLENGKTLSAPLIIGADGRGSFMRNWLNIETKKWSYNQTALVSIVTHENAHDNIAVEHFHEDGPVAILPMSDDAKGNHRSSVVWTQPAKTKSTKKSAFDYNEQTFKAALQTRFPKRYGTITPISERLAYPLNFLHASEYVAPRMALIADAAHGIHPIAGQGLNLGLRDIDALVSILSNAKKDNKDIGDLSILEKYQNARRPDNTAMAIGTDMLNKLFSNNFKSVKLIRKIGLRAVQKIKPSKLFFMRQTMGIKN